MNDTKYIDVAGLLREQFKPNLGVLLVVFEPRADDADKAKAHIALHVDYCIREQVPQVLEDLTKRLNDEIRLEDLAERFDYIERGPSEAN